MRADRYYLRFICDGEIESAAASGIITRNPAGINSGPAGGSSEIDMMCESGGRTLFGLDQSAKQQVSVPSYSATLRQQVYPSGIIKWRKKKEVSIKPKGALSDGTRIISLLLYL